MTNTAFDIYRGKAVAVEYGTKMLMLFVPIGANLKRKDVKCSSKHLDFNSIYTEYSLYGISIQEN